ncbi:hypothetical protein [Burkholderia anthina]|uniref:hypothetical protein n=1 Tax=Burkholderia anthina TaxID=179879 RepID=UPI00158AFABA|nr:hypothetical protein [Burkholderia anthina]
MTLLNDDMKHHKLILSALLVFSSSAFSKGVAVTIEDADLRSSNESISAVVKKNPSFSPFETLKCKITGKEISLATSSDGHTYFATTADACGWGGALGPIWLVDQSQGTVILSTGGYAVKVKQRVRHGFHDVDVSSGTAGETMSGSYFFDGKKYIAAKKRAHQ